MGKQLVGIVLFAIAAAGQATDPAYAPLEKAYDALRTNRYDEAVAHFGRAIALAPGRAAIRKDLAYTLLKIGETEAARDQFAEAMLLDPADDHVALEYAFLCYETKQQAIARRVFDRIRKTGNQTASEAFENVDRPLREGIARWKQALELSPDNFSAHEELARLAEQRDEPRPGRRTLRESLAVAAGPAGPAAGSGPRLEAAETELRIRMRRC